VPTLYPSPMTPVPAPVVFLTWSLPAGGCPETGWAGFEARSLYVRQPPQKKKCLFFCQCSSFSYVLLRSRRRPDHRDGVGTNCRGGALEVASPAASLSLSRSIGCVLRKRRAVWLRGRFREGWQLTSSAARPEKTTHCLHATRLSSLEMLQDKGPGSRCAMSG
jgi:hypothetical protein